jgi:hypothetical protein
VHEVLIMCSEWGSFTIIGAVILCHAIQSHSGTETVRLEVCSLTVDSGSILQCAFDMCWKHHATSSLLLLGLIYQIPLFMLRSCIV